MVGPVDAVDPVGQTLVVLGQIVRGRSQTVYR
jgi:hypothetical protein